MIATRGLGCALLLVAGTMIVPRAGDKNEASISHTVRVDADFVVSASALFGPDVYFELAPGAQFIVNPGQTLTIHSPEHIRCPARQKVFTLVGTGAVSFTNSGTVYPGWWGAAGDGMTDDTAAIQAAVNAAGKDGCVPFGCGDT